MYIGSYQFVININLPFRHISYLGQHKLSRPFVVI